VADIVVNIAEPNEKQKLFLQDTHKYVFFGGARGGGKSWVVRVDAFKNAMKYAGITMIILRRSYPELYANHIKPFLEWLPKEIYKYNDSKKEMRFINGSTLLFGYCSNEKDLLQYQGQQYDIVYPEEATMFTEEMIKVLSACIRGTNGFPKQMKCTGNPGGVGHSFFKRLFVDRQYQGNENPDDYSFIQSLPTDNKALMEAQPDYIRQLEALPKKLRDAWLLGKWDIFEGAVFEEWSNNPDGYDTQINTHVINPFEIPPNWRIYRSYDHGYNKPFSVGWYAVSEDGVAYRILEWYGCQEGEANVGIKMLADDIFQQIYDFEHTHRWLKGKEITGIADPAIWGTDRGESINDIAVKHGVYFQKGDNHRLNGLQQCHYRLRFDENGYAMFYVFNTCKEFIRTIPLLQYDEKKVEDVATEMEDHIYDEWRYFLQSRPIAPPKAKADDGWENNPLNYALQIDKEMLAPAPSRAEKVTVITDGTDSNE
jgi:hypothetical protein